MKIPFGGHYDGGEPNPGQTGQAPNPDTTPKPPEGFNEEQIKQIGGLVNTAIENSQKPAEGDPNPDGSGDYYSPDPGQGGAPPSAGYNPYADQGNQYPANPGGAGGGVSNQGGYVPPQPYIPPDQNSQRLNEVENVAVQNQETITRMNFKSNLDDMIDENPNLRPLRKGALELQEKHAKLGENIAADTIVNLMVGKSARKKIAEERALQNTNTEGDLAGGGSGATKPKHPMDMSVEEIEEKYGRIEF